MSTVKTLPPVGADAQLVVCGRVACDPRRLTQLDGRGTAAFAVPFNDVRRITAGFGYRSQHPLLQATFGLGMVLLGYYPAVHLVRWLRAGGAFFDVEALAIPLAVLGAWLVSTAFARGYVLDIWSAAGRRRLAFGTGVAEAELAVFVAVVQGSAGVAVERV